MAPSANTAPRWLDLFCGAGGVSRGLVRAGCRVLGVDIADQPSYPYAFYRADALWFLKHMGEWGEFDGVWASPPCQDYSKAMRHLSKPQPRLIEPVMEALEATGLPWIIENVAGAPLATSSDLLGRHGVQLCGTMFGLRIRRHRLFEASFPLPAMACIHSAPAMNPHNQRGRDRIYAEFGRGDPERVWRAEMDVAWMTRYEAREAIPPAYSEWLGRQWLAGRTVTA